MASIVNPIVFARSPAGLNEDLLDYSKSDDVKIYQSAIAPLTPLYDGEPGGLLTFLERLIIRAELSNWKNIIMTPYSDGVDCNLLTEHGRLTMSDVRAYSETYNGLRGRKEQQPAPAQKSTVHNEAVLQLKAAYASLMEDIDNQE